MGIFCDIQLPLAWSWIEGARIKVADLLSGHDAGVREGAVMVASELAENVVKYGESLIACDVGRIQVTLDERSIRIVSTNGVQSEENLQRLSERLRAINESGDAEAMYLERMREALANPKGGDGQMGLYRIVYEGGYRLSHDYDGTVLTIVAERYL